MEYDNEIADWEREALLTRLATRLDQLELQIAELRALMTSQRRNDR